MPWRTIDDPEPVPQNSVELEVLIKGVFQKHRFLDLILNFIAFEDDGQEISKKIAAYHQFHAVNKAVACAFSACGFPYDPQILTGRYPAFIDEEEANSVRSTYENYTTPGHFKGRRIGVIWHTQGSFKSLSMTFFAGKLIRHPGMQNPTIVIITDRNDLDNQLFATFSNCRDLLRQKPRQAQDKDDLKRLLQTPSGGVIFTTIQKFQPDKKRGKYPELSNRENIIVIADEAHRSQYDFIDGFARHLHDALPNASFIGFTGTPIESGDRSTPAVFGDYIDKYDILRAVRDGATVPIYYESRLAKIELLESEKPKIDPEFEEITEAAEEYDKQKLQSKWARLEAMVGTEKRIQKVAEDLLAHFDHRLAVMDGKGLIVCMSRRICVDMYNAIVKLKPGWHSSDDSQGNIKIVMTGSITDAPSWRSHIRAKTEREALAKRFKNPDDPLKLVIVRDMWLTGFDCPALHTMYIDKPMRSHGLMQAIARVNRVFKDKPGGLVVDYIGLIEQLHYALAQYTQAGGLGKATVDIEEAVLVLQEKYDILVDMLHGFDYKKYVYAGPGRRLQGIAAAIDHIVALEDGKKQFLTAVTNLSKAFALSVPHENALKIRDEIRLFQEIRSGILKTTVEGTERTDEEMDTAVRQLIARAITSDEVIDIFALAGLDKPDISILSDTFLQEIRNLRHKNLAVELLRKLLHDEIKTRSRKNIVQARSFAQMLEETIRRYQNRTIETSQVIEELIGIGREMREARRRGEETGLNEDEIAFYEALEVNDSAVKVLGDKTLKLIARELVSAVRKNVSIDWTLRENARAKIRVLVKGILRKYGYPPDKEKKAADTVLEQAETLCKEWTITGQTFVE
jgi:type I restriction enzyme R subunit